MKLFLPVTLGLLLAACATTPQDKEAAHQSALEKEARENFYALKAQQHPNAPPAPAPTAAPTPAPHLIAFLGNRSAEAASPATSSRPAPPPRQRATPAPKPRRPKPGETAYYWRAQPHTPARKLREQAAEARYARKLAKNPEDLTPEERVWAHEHY